MQLIDPGRDYLRFFDALQSINVPGNVAMLDPVLALRMCASAELVHLEQFLFLATRERVDLQSMDEDEGRLLSVGVLARLLSKARQIRASKHEVTVPEGDD